MKKVFYAFLVAISLIGCKSSDYKIEGAVDRKMDGITVSLKERVDHEWISMDSTTVKDGKFEFKGTCDSARIVYFLYEYPAGNKAGQAFVLECGRITAKVDAENQISITGTEQNDVLQAYQDEKNTFYKKTEAFYNSHNDSTMSQVQKDVLKKQLEKMSQQEVAIDLKYAKQQVNTLIGTQIFNGSSYNMTIEQKESIVALMNEKTKNNPRIQEIIKNIEIEKKVAVGQSFVDFSLPTPAGTTLKLSDLVGKTDYVLIDFWASWCGPCMRSLPDMKGLYVKYKVKKLEILGVSLDENREAWLGVIAQKQLGWKHVSDLKGWKSEGSQSYAVSAIPCTVLIDKAGKIVGRNMEVSDIDNLLSSKTEKK